MAHVAKNFSREKMADETMNVYAELLQEKYKTNPYDVPLEHAAE